MRTKAIPRLETKLPTLPAARKRSGDAMTKDHFFDPDHLFESIMSSDIGKQVHQGFGLWVDNETECWHKEAWLSSCPSTSGHYTHYPDGEPIFPSDFVARILDLLVHARLETEVTQTLEVRPKSHNPLQRRILGISTAGITLPMLFPLTKETLSPNARRSLVHEPSPFCQPKRFEL
jgi:hypothetical protein